MSAQNRETDSATGMRGREGEGHKVWAVHHHRLSLVFMVPSQAKTAPPSSGEGIYIEFAASFGTVTTTTPHKEWNYGHIEASLFKIPRVPSTLRRQLT